MRSIQSCRKVPIRLQYEGFSEYGSQYTSQCNPAKRMRGINLRNLRYIKVCLCMVGFVPPRLLHREWEEQRATTACSNSGECVRQDPEKIDGKIWGRPSRVLAVIQDYSDNSSDSCIANVPPKTCYFSRERKSNGSFVPLFGKKHEPH